MSTSRFSALPFALTLFFTACSSTPVPIQLGQPVAGNQLAGFDLIIEPDGNGLPEGNGTAAQGRVVYNNRCQSCHGAEGEGAIPALRLVGGDMQSETAPLRTVGSFWPYATTIFDYVRRAMPADAPKSLSDTEVYQVTAYLLFLNGIIGESELMDRQTLPAVAMPNRNGFIDYSAVQ